MKTIKLLRITVSIFTLLFIFALSSCGKKDESPKVQDTGNKEQLNTGFNESNEDLLSVNYDYFYKELSPKGEWIEVNSKDLGLDIKPGTTQNEGRTGYNTALDILGIKTAYAQTDEELINIFVWRPFNELATTVINENTEKQYTPYNNGQWIYTDRGWYFKAATPQEDLTSHYGRWTEDPQLGWVWLPGKVWSPAWVDWRENEDYTGWAPVPPGAYIKDNTISQYTINDNRYTIVEKKHFIEPGVYKYRYQYVENKNKIMIKEMTKKDGIMIKDKTVINKGPDVGDIEKKSGKKIEVIKIKNTNKKDDPGSVGEISVFTPDFKSEKSVKKEPVTKPEKLVSYKDAKKITKDEKDALKEEDKMNKKEEKELKKEEKEKQKEDKGNKKENEQKDPKKNDDKSKGNDKDKKSNNDNVKEKKNDDKGKKK